MRKWIISLNDRMHFFIIFTGTVATAFIVAFLVHFLFESIAFDRDIVLIGIIYQVVGTLYAVLLAFTLLGVWNNFSKAEWAVQTEAFALLDLVQIMEASHSKNSVNIRNAALEYLDIVVTQEWPTLKKLTQDVVILHEKSRLSSVKMVHLVQKIEPTNDREIAIFKEGLALLSAWLDARRERILIARGNTAKPFWPLLLTGAVFLFSFHGLFVASSNSLWVTLLLGMAVIVALAFYLVFSLDTPFSGALSVDSGPFQWAISSLKTYKPDMQN
jgi:hypothetical protein